MADLILLPAVADLADGTFASDTPVWRLSAVGGGIRATLAQALTGVRSPVLLLHPQDARSARVKVPRLAAENLARAAALALEDQVISDPQQLVLAIGERRGDLLDVTFTDKALLSQLKSALGQLGAPQAPVGAAAAALQGDAVWLDGERACVFREGQCAVVPVAAVQLAVADMPPCSIYGATEGVEIPAGWQSKSGVPPFAVPATLFIDIKSRNAARRVWRLPAALLGVLALTWIVGLTVWWQVLESEAKRLNTAIADQFAKALPGTPITDDPILQLQRASSAGTVATTPFEKAVIAADKAAAALPAQTVLSAEFTAGRLTLKLAKDKVTPAIKTQFEAAVRDAGLKLSWLSAESVALSMASGA